MTHHQGKVRRAGPAEFWWFFLVLEAGLLFTLRPGDPTQVTAPV